MPWSPSSSPRRFLTGVVAAAALAALPTLTACSTDESSAAPTAGATGTPSSSASAPKVTPTARATFGATPVEQKMAWFLGQMNTAPIDKTPTRHFDAAFLAQLPPEQLIVMFGQLRAQGPWVAESVSSKGTQGSAVVVGAGKRFTMTMTLDSAGLISGALLQSSAVGSTATDWAGVRKRAELGAPQVSILAADVDASGKLDVVHRSGDQGMRPIASMFKLYVLAAVTERVAAGTLSWSRPLTLTAADKSLPTGELQNKPDGTTISVRDAATAMISISDNTATDLLIRTVGEQAVLDAAKNAGNTHLEGLTPLLTTRQMFWLAWDDSEAGRTARTEWKGSDAARRRELLAAIKITGPGPARVEREKPHWDQGIGWYATPHDIAKAQFRLQQLAATPAGAPVRDIMSKNGGIKVPGWSAQAFKGGSDVGVIGLSLWGRTAGRPARNQVLVMIGTGPAPVDEATFIAAATDAANLLATSR